MSLRHPYLLKSFHILSLNMSKLFNNILLVTGYNFTPDDIKDAPSKVLTFHRITEAFKFAFAKRSELGDGKFVPDVYSVCIAF